MKMNKYLLALGLAAGLSMGFTGCGGTDEGGDDAADTGTNSVGSLSTVSGATLGSANTTTAAALEAFFDNSPDELFEELADDMESLVWFEEDTYSSPFSFTYACTTSGTVEVSGTYDDDYDIATATIKANDCVGASYYVDEIDGTFYYAMNESGVTYEAKTDVVYSDSYTGAGTFSQGSAIVYTRTGTNAVSATVNIEYVDDAGEFYRVENMTYDATLDEYDDFDSIDLNGARIYVSETSYVEYVSDTLTMGTYGPVGDVLFSAADNGELTVTFSTYGSATATVTSESTSTDNTDDTASGTATALSDAITVNGTLTTATDKMTYEATDFTGVSYTCSYVYIRVEDVNGSTDNPDSGLTSDVDVTIYKDGVESITLDPSPGYAVGSLKALDSSYNVISKITVEVEPKDNSAANVGTFTIKYSNPCN